MPDEIHGLKVDLIRRQGLFLQIGEDGGLTRNDLAEHQIGMMVNNSIPGLLYMETEKRPSGVFFRYDVSSRKALPQWLQAHTLSLNQFYELLLHLAGILQESKLFMLEPQNYILLESFIYVGRSLREVELVYLPMADLGKRQSIHREFAALTGRLIAFVERLDGDGVQQLVKIVQAEDYRIEDVIHLLERLLDDGKGDIGRQKDGESMAAHGGETACAPERRRGLSRLLPFAPLKFLWKRGRTGPPAEQAQSPDAVADRHVSTRYYQTLEHQTSLLNGKDATVCLSGSRSPFVPPQCLVLHVRRGQETEQVPITGKTFTIGRSREDAHYLDDSAGVSRLHCEIARKENLWTVKDLGSKNGSFLNGAPMVPYKEYSFQVGDILKIIRSEYTLTTQS